MNKVLLFGGTGNLGRCIASVLKEKNFITTAVTRNKNKSEELKPLVSEVIVTDLSNKEKLIGLSAGYDIIISSLGKSVSPFDKSKTGFRETDYRINADIIDEALENGTGKFVYVSAFHAEHYPDLEYFKVHQDVSDKLMSSGLNFSIIKPPAIYSAFKDAFALAAKGLLVTLGKGDKKTNPIYEGDLARIIVDSINTENTIVEAGGPEILTRHEINEIIQTEIAPGKKVRHCPLLAIDLFLPLLKTLNRNLYDKVAFFSAVMKEDTVAPQRGKMPFSEYVRLYK